jgi:membrane protease YdiL (CAAX protease family)
METLPLEETAHFMPTRRARWGPWATLAWAAGGGLVMMVSQTIGAGVYLLWLRMAHPERSIPLDSLASNGPLLTFAFLVSTPFVLGYFVLAVKLTGIPLTEYLALKWPRWFDIVIGIAALAAVLLLAGLAASASGQETPQFMTETFASARAAGMLPLFAFSFMVLPPLQEEILFRGFLYRGLVPALGPAATIVATSAVWAVIHLQYDWFFVAEIFLLGIALGWLRWKSGSTILTMMLHATMNGLALLQLATT